jgi:predicted transcriptional regulator
MKTSVETLLIEIDEFQLEFGIRDTALGRMISNSPALVLRLRTGANSPRAETVDMINKFMAEARANRIAFRASLQKKTSRRGEVIAAIAA